jgi:predicted kinase
MPRLIVLTGAPAVGKTGAARELAAALRVPIIEKDRFKERLYEVFGHGDAIEPKIEEAALAILFSVVERHLEAGLTVLAEGNFDRSHAPAFRRLHDAFPHDLVQIQFERPPEETAERFAERAEAGERHPGHEDDPEDAEELRADIEAGRYDPLDVPGEVVRVHPDELDVEALARRVVPEEAARPLS